MDRCEVEVQLKSKGVAAAVGPTGSPSRSPTGLERFHWKAQTLSPAGAQLLPASRRAAPRIGAILGASRGGHLTSLFEIFSSNDFLGPVDGQKVNKHNSKSRLVARSLQL